jgi:hypothetical protein
MRETIPLSERKIDVVFIAFWILNLTLITYIVDLEQIVIDDPADFEYPIWPPGPLVDMVHWWGTTFDPVQYARPPWWRATIWIDALLFGPFYGSTRCSSAPSTWRRSTPTRRAESGFATRA